MSRESVTVGCWAGFWGDSPAALEQIVRGPRVDSIRITGLNPATEGPRALHYLAFPNIQ